MKNFILLVCGLLLFASASAQKIKETSVTKNDLDYLLKNSIVICAKVDTLDNKGMIKTVEIICRDTTFNFIGAYMESNVFFPDNNMKLKCDFVVIDGFFITLELDSLGRKWFEPLLNKVLLMEPK